MKMLPLHWMLVLLALVSGATARAEEKAELSPALRVLTIGNSFANDATRFLPGLAEAGGKKLVIFGANLGGHSLEQHANYLTAAPDDPRSHPYKKRKHPLTGEQQDFSLSQALTALPWDVVTIQQVSHQSFRPDSYEPHAGTLVALIRKLAPQAKILIHQTWAYREDHPMFSKGDGFDQKKMFDGLKAAYAALGASYQLPIIPVGEAFQRARSEPEWSFRFPDPKFDYKSPAADAVPEQIGSLNVGWGWRRDPTTGEVGFRLDAIHANTAGCYLGAAVFYETLFGENVEGVDYVPKGLSEEAAAKLRRLAHEVVSRQYTVVPAQTSARTSR